MYILDMFRKNYDVFLLCAIILSHHANLTCWLFRSTRCMCPPAISLLFFSKDPRSSKRLICLWFVVVRVKCISEGKTTRMYKEMTYGARRPSGELWRERRSTLGRQDKLGRGGFFLPSFSAQRKGREKPKPFVSGTSLRARIFNARSKKPGEFIFSPRVGAVMVTGSDAWCAGGEVGAGWSSVKD